MFRSCELQHSAFEPVHSSSGQQTYDTPAAANYAIRGPIDPPIHFNVYDDDRRPGPVFRR